MVRAIHYRRLISEQELLPSISSLISDPFASHVIRALFLLFYPSISAANERTSIVRSKKSSKHRAKQGPMTSVFTGSLEDSKEGAKGKAKEVLSAPPAFITMAQKLVENIRSTLSPNEIRALAADKSACPVLVVRWRYHRPLAEANNFLAFTRD